MTVTVDDTKLKAIADAIRAKNGTTETYKPSEMASAIEAIKSGGVSEVEELPTESNIGSIYKIVQPCLIDVIYVTSRLTYRAMPYSENFYYVKTKPTENIAESNEDGSISNPYYVEDENDVFFYINGSWVSFSAWAEMSYKGTVENAVDATEIGYYAVIGTENVYCEYVNELANVIWVRNGTVTVISTLVPSTNFYTIPTQTTEGILRSDGGDTAYIYYIEDEKDVFMYNGGWRSLSYNFGDLRGEITDIADAKENGYYILFNKWKRYRS
jgi:hypothetical protein